jgi:hypothetical protein
MLPAFRPPDSWHRRVRTLAVVLLAAVLGAALPPARAAGPVADAPGRVGRLSLVNGEVDAALDDASDWGPALLNAPVTTGTAVRTAASSRAEVRIGSAALHLAGNGELRVETLDDHVVMLDLVRGQLVLQWRVLNAGERVVVHAAGASFELTAPGMVHLAHTPGNARFESRVFEGAGLVGGVPAALPLTAGQQAVFDTHTTVLLSQGVAERTRFDDWAAQRLRRAERTGGSERYVSAEMTGAEALDEQGRWRVDARYGAVWTPNVVAVDWAPYRYGRWVWVSPWGWTWVDEAPWGFAPFHYGRWLFLAGRWGWVPGGYVARPPYAPALVGFYGSPGAGAPWTAGGGGELVGWFPLAPGEPYRPGFPATAHYLQGVNAGVPAAAAPGTGYRYAQTSFAATAVGRDAFGAAVAVAARRVDVAPTALTNAVVMHNHQAPVPAPATAAARAVSKPPEAAVRPAPAGDRAQREAERAAAKAARSAAKPHPVHAPHRGREAAH